MVYPLSGSSWTAFFKFQFGNFTKVGKPKYTEKKLWGKDENQQPTTDPGPIPARFFALDTSCTFSRALHRLHKFASSPDWFIVATNS